MGEAAGAPAGEGYSNGIVSAEAIFSSSPSIVKASFI